MNIGEILTPFELKSTSGKMVNSFNYHEYYALAIFITCNHCKYSQAYWNRIIKLANKFEEDNLAVVAINPNNPLIQPQDSFENIVQLSNQLNLPFEYLFDENQQVAKQLGATKTPEVFLFNSRRELVYKGAIDDSWDNEQTVTHVYLEDAIEYSLDGIEVDYPEVDGVGCSIKW